MTTQKSYVYDQAKNYYNSPDYPRDISNEQAFVPTGMYLGWLLDKGFYSDYFYNEAKNQIKRFKKRKISGSRIYKIYGGLLAEYMLNDEGNRFTKYYFDNFKHGLYKQDYQELLLDDLSSIFAIADNWDNFKIIKKRIDKRYKEWKRKNKKWWQFWK
jgi:hypothetical protein